MPPLLLDDPVVPPLELPLEEELELEELPEDELLLDEELELELELELEELTAPPLEEFDPLGGLAVEFPPPQAAIDKVTASMPLIATGLTEDQKARIRTLFLSCDRKTNSGLLR